MSRHFMIHGARQVGKTWARAQLAKRGPVGRALHVEAMRQHLLTISIDIYMRAEGEPSLDLLSHLAWMIGIGAEVAVHVMPGTVEAKRLHADLRMIVATAAAGGGWVRSQAPTLAASVEASKVLMLAHADIALHKVEGADELAAAIKAGRANLDQVAGAELYATTGGA